MEEGTGQKGATTHVSFLLWTAPGCDHMTFVLHAIACNSKGNGKCSCYYGWLFDQLKIGGFFTKRKGRDSQG